MRSIKLPSWTERLIGLDPPVAPPPHAFALDENELRYGCFQRGAEGLVYEASSSLLLPGEIFGEGVLGAPMRDPRALQNALEGFVRDLGVPIKEASLVLPDTWLRISFVEIGEMPRKRQAREEMLRWKLKRKLPFRVEDLRISEVMVTPFPTQEEPSRLLVGFSIELLIQQLEEAFAAVGIELGRITNTTLAVAASIEHGVAPGDLAGLVTVQPDAYTLSFFRHGEPLLYRYKAVGEAGVSGGAVHRDLRLTSSFLHQHYPETSLSRVFLAAPPEQENQWLEWLEDELDTVPEPLGFEHFQISRTQVGPYWLDTAPLLGVASDEVPWA